MGVEVEDGQVALPRGAGGYRTGSERVLAAQHDRELTIREQLRHGRLHAAGH